MREQLFTNEFKKQFKLAQKRGNDMALLKEIMRELALGNPLPPKYRDHALVGKYFGCRECHLKPDWLLVYRVNASEIIFVCTGSHSDLFD